MKTVIILLGPKGSGKTYVGRLIEKNFSVKFIPVEKIFLKIKKGRNITGPTFLKAGFKAVAKEINQALKEIDTVVIESTGVFPYFKGFLKKLRGKYLVKLVKIYAPFEICRQRIKKRNASEHIPMSEQTIKKVFVDFNKQKYNYLIQIDTSTETNEKIINDFKGILINEKQKL